MKAVIGIPSDGTGYYDDCECFMFCPFCKSVSGNNVIFSDYVTLPMLWCDACGARSVLDMQLKFNDEHGLDLIGDMNELKHTHPDLNYNIDSLDKYILEDINVYKYYYVNLLFIEKVTNGQLSDYNSDILLERDDVCKFIESNYSDELKSNLNLTYITLNDNDPTFTVYLACDSYNSVNPLISYPTNFSMAHDGCCIYLQCNKGGESFCVTYWGD